MGLFSKDEKIPSLPKVSTLPELPKESKEPEKKDLPGLPSFPTNSKNENLNQEMVKSAVVDIPSPGENEVNVEIPKGIHVREEGEEEVGIPPIPSSKQIPSIPKAPILPPIATPTPVVAPIMPAATPHRSSLNEPIFVRIDKFQSSQKNFVQIKEKIEKIELVLKKIEEVKSKEEDELAGWTEDITKIKSQLAEVDADIFDQI